MLSFSQANIQLFSKKTSAEKDKNQFHHKKTSLKLGGTRKIKKRKASDLISSNPSCLLSSLKKLTITPAEPLSDNLDAFIDALRCAINSCYEIFAGSISEAGLTSQLKKIVDSLSVNNDKGRKIEARNLACCLIQTFISGNNEHEISNLVRDIFLAEPAIKSEMENHHVQNTLRYPH